MSNVIIDIASKTNDESEIKIVNGIKISTKLRNINESDKNLINNDCLKILSVKAKLTNAYKQKISNAYKEKIT